MNESSPYPGTLAHQVLLRALVDHYAGDPRVRAVCVFGSLSRGNWDEYSDLDLDVVLADGVQVDAATEVERLCWAFAPLGERALLIIPRQRGSADVVLASLNRFSIRYHHLGTTSPNIVDSLRVLAGSLSTDAITTAGLANREPNNGQLTPHLDRIVRWTIDADAAIRRGKFWQMVLILQSMREELLVLFAVTHGGDRPYHTFDQLAPPELAACLSSTLPVHDLLSARAALASLLDLIEHETVQLTNTKTTLTPEQLDIIHRVRQRLSQLE